MSNYFDPNPKCPKTKNSENVCKAIYESYGRLSTMVRTLSRTTIVERREIKETYKAMYGEELPTHLHKLKVKLSSGNNNAARNNEDSKFSSKACEALYLWVCDPWDRDACLAKEAIEKNDADYMVLVEMFVGRKSSHVLMIKQAYQTKVKRQLEHDIVTLEPPNPYQKILVALSTSHKAHHADVSQDIAKCDAMRLYQTGEGSSVSINEAVVLEILSKRSIPQLKLTFSSYKRIYGHSYTKQLKKIHSTQFEDAIRNVVECIQDPPKYYAKMLQRSMKGGETSKGLLTRLMVSRAETDMGDIQRVYRKKYGMELKNAISQSIPSGDYRDFLLALAENA